MAGPDNIIDVFLQPGDYFVGDAGFRVSTLLGSCVSITLWQPQLRIGAMSHFLLPARAPGGADDGDLDGRYGEEALALMLDELARLGVRGGACEAKIFGGGNMFARRRCDGGGVGRQNGETARRLLADLAIPVRSQCLFGDGHRQIVFELASGDVWSRQIPAAHGVPPWPGVRA
ncbi:chemotaxis protein CheD [Janthinobacterium fluminis]|uniref:Probable chemoreceptor glutamine deamidase CheD n=1 Tax=Janthinobacterium fluminis TaxID=2987524 RepID=A0ABT5JUR7_9BURK|nr:chemotaxis protein CheD [Janthinobacterium fluminis]MDC8756459.1 chemotaxis protein CheD [Janthinobacterium fluminis]